MAPRQTGLSFFGWVGAIMAGLKLKETWDGYKRVSEDDGEGRVSLPAYNDAEPGEQDSFIDTEIQRPSRARPKRKSCCVCCGLNCGLFWKAFGIVFGGFMIWYLLKFVIWAAKPAETGLENMPEFATSLACRSAPHVYNGGETTIQVPTGRNRDHALDLRGSTGGRFVLAQGAEDSEFVQYKVVIRTDDASLLEHVSITSPDIEDDADINNSRTILSMPRLGQQCMHFDITIYLPPKLRVLHIGSHSLTHLEFDPDSDIEIEELYLTLFRLDPNNIIRSDTNIRGQRQDFEVYRGWIVGDVPVVSWSTVTTQRGDGVAHVKFHPTTPFDKEKPELATVQTASGAGRTDIFYIDDTPSMHRPIHATHMSSKGGNVYLTYKESGFNGMTNIESESYTVTGAQPVRDSTLSYTHQVRDGDGEDRMTVKSRSGWAGVYF